MTEIFIWADMADDKVSDQKAMPKVCSNHLFLISQAGVLWVSIWPLIVQIMVASIFNSSPSLFKNRADIDHYMKGYNDTLMLLDYLEGQAVVDKGNEAAAKWFKKVEPKVVDPRTNMMS